MQLYASSNVSGTLVGSLLRQPVEDLGAERHQRAEGGGGGARRPVAQEQQVARPRLCTHIHIYA
eukprot:scaffold26739_cov45-Phaeocystis_antarctica.AAC.1